MYTRKKEYETWERKVFKWKKKKKETLPGKFSYAMKSFDFKTAGKFVIIKKLANTVFEFFFSFFLNVEEKKHIVNSQQQFLKVRVDFFVLEREINFPFKKSDSNKFNLKAA